MTITDPLNNVISISKNSLGLLNLSPSILDDGIRSIKKSIEEPTAIYAARETERWYVKGRKDGVTILLNVVLKENQWELSDTIFSPGIEELHKINNECKLIYKNE